MRLHEQDYRESNRRGWNQLARDSSVHSTPVGPDDFPWARQIIDPQGWLPWRRIRTVLCLASAGGQQAPLLASLGLQVTVADLSPDQLALDREVASRYELDLECVEVDMQDLTPLRGRRFDFVYQPVSMIYVPDPRRVYAEVATLQAPGGIYRVAHWNPVQMQLPAAGAWDGEGYRLTLPQHPAPMSFGTSGPRTPGDPWTNCVHYVHPLDDLLGGLCDAGYVVTRLSEWSPDADGQPPDTLEHRGTYIPTVLTVLARRRGERVRTGGQP